MNYPYSTIVVVDDNSAILTALKICLAAEFEHVVTDLARHACGYACK